MKKKLFILLTFMFFTPFIIKAEEIKIEWQKNYGGSDYDFFTSAVSTDDGGFVAVGTSSSTNIEEITNQGSNDGIIVKFDSNGNIEWQKNYGGNNLDDFDSVVLTNDGGFVAVGSSSSTNIEGIENHGSNDGIIVKYDSKGNIEWQKNYGGNGDDYYLSVALVNNGDLVAVGYSLSTNIEGIVNKGSSDAIIVKYDQDGNLLWHRSYGGNELDNFVSVVSTSDEGVMVICGTNSNDIEGLQSDAKGNPLVVKYDKSGEILWQRLYRGNYADNFESIISIEDNGYIVAGSVQSTDIQGIINNGASDALITKFDKEGNIIWNKNFGGDSHDEFDALVRLNNLRFVAVGNSLSTNMDGLECMGYDYEDVCHDAIILGYDNDGKLIWKKNYGGNNYDYFKSIILLKNGEIVVVGHSLSTDIDGITNLGFTDAIVVKFSVEYNLENIVTENGLSTAVRDGNHGIISTTPNEGYEVDKIIIKDKDGSVLDVEVIKQDDGTYSFDLYTDVSIEVIYKEKIENPKTGILDVFTIIFVGFFISIFGFFIVKRYNERFEF